MNNKQKSINNLLCAIFGQMISIAFGLILPRLFVVSYGSEVNGLLSSLSNFLICLSLFEAGVGIASLQALYKPVAEQDWPKINGVLAATKGYYRKTGRCYLIALIVLSLGYPLIVDSDLSYLTVCGAFFFSGIGNVVSFYIQGKYILLIKAENKNYILSNLSTLTNMLISLSKVLLIYLGVNIVTILAVSFLIQCLQVVYILHYIRKNYPKLDLNAEPDRLAVSQKNYALIHQIGALVFNNTDVVILTMICGLKVVSVYSVFKMISGHLDQILNLVTNSVSAALGQNYQTNRERYKQMIDVFESIYSVLAYGFYAVALYLYLPFMRLYMAGVTDINYVDGKLAILFVAAGLLSHSRVPMVQTIDYAGHFKQTTSYSLAEMVINLVTSLVGVWVWGIYGVLLGTVAALLYRTNQIIIYANTQCLNRKPWRTYAVYLVNLLVLLATTVVFDLLFGGIEIDSYLKLILVGVGATVTSLGMFLLAQIVCFPDCRKAVAGIGGLVRKRIFNR